MLPQRRFSQRIGALLIISGIFLSLMKKSDMEKWVYNGFWGSSPKYWGDTSGRYEWNNNRLLSKKFGKQLENSQFTCNLQENGELIFKKTDEHGYFKIEIERFFTFTEKIIVSKIDNQTLKVLYNGLIDNQMAQQLKVPLLKFKLRVETFMVYEAKLKKPNIEFKQKGQAIIHLPDNWNASYIADVKTPHGWQKATKYKRFTSKEIGEIYAKVTLPPYDGDTKGRPLVGELPFDND